MPHTTIYDLATPAYKANLSSHPDCRDPDHLGCTKCWEIFEEPEDAEDFNKEPVPYDNNKEA